MARNNQGHLQLPEMDHIPHNESLSLGQKLLLHHGSDAPLRIGHSSHGNVGLRSNDLPSSSRTAQTGYRVGNPGTSHAPFVHCHAGSSSSHLPEPAVNYPHRSEEGFAPVGAHMDNRRAAIKRKEPSVHPAGISAAGYYVGSSSNTQPSNSVQPNPAPLAEPFRQIPLSIDQSGWDGQHLIHQEGFQRNVRARHSHNISLEPRSASTYPLNSAHVPSFGSTASASSSTSVERNQAPVSVPTRTVPPGITSRALTGRAYYPVVGSSSSSVGAIPIIHGSAGTAIFANGDYAPSTVQAGTVPTYPSPAPATSSGSRAMPHQMFIQSHPPATSAATSATSTSMQPLPARIAAASRHARHVSVGNANNGRYRRARSSYYHLHPLMAEAERFMMDQLVFYESRAAAADPHRDMRLDIDNMSYEELLALEESIGSVNTGLADEKISKCVKEVVCCSDQTQIDQDDQDDGSCVICQEGYKDKDMLGILKCKHDFHADCIKKWLQTKNSCPVCKTAAA